MTRYGEQNISSNRISLQERVPHEPITDDTEIRMNTRTLATELTCPICLDLLTSTMTTKVRLPWYIDLGSCPGVLLFVLHRRSWRYREQNGINVWNKNGRNSG